MSNRTSIGRRRRLTVVSAIIATGSLAACSSADNKSAATATTSQGPAAAPTSVASSPGPSTTTSPETATTEALAVESEQHDGALEARVHVVLADVDAPNIDLLVDGVVAINGGQAQANIPVGYTTAYLYLPPGTHQVAVTPTGSGLAKELVAPVDVAMLAGHRYLIAFMGRTADHSLTPLVIDETRPAPTSVPPQTIRSRSRSTT